MKEKILLLSSTSPPIISGAATVVSNLAKQFGRDEMILAGQKPVGMPPMPWSDQWPRIVRIAFSWPYARGTRYWERYWQWIQFPYLLFRCIQLVLWHRITSILVVYPRVSFLLAAYLTSLLTRRRLYLYFHNTYYENCFGWRKTFAGWLQRRLFRRAEHLFTMSEGMSELYRRHYPGLSQSPLVHTFNGPVPEFQEPPPVHSPLQLIMIGNLVVSCADAVRRIGQAVAAVPDVHLTLLPAMSHKNRALLGLLADNITSETVAADQLVPRLGAADIVVLPHGLTGPLAAEEYQTIFPTRVIEYLLSGRPMLAHSTAGSFITRFLIENQCALVVDQPDLELLGRAIECLRTDAELRSRLVRNAMKTAERFQASRVAAELRRHLV
jgi:glycosyltransferase involved in cell wall biosynthesis